MKAVDRRRRAINVDRMRGIVRETNVWSKNDITIRDIPVSTISTFLAFGFSTSDGYEGQRTDGEVEV
jgi:hypothetical protein